MKSKYKPNLPENYGTLLQQTLFSWTSYPPPVVLCSDSHPRHHPRSRSQTPQRSRPQLIFSLIPVPGQYLQFIQLETCFSHKDNVTQTKVLFILYNSILMF